MSNVTAHGLLGKAGQHLSSRGPTYDQPQGERSMAKVIAIFNVKYGTSLSESQGWDLLQILKDVREMAAPAFHADSAEDELGYCALKNEARAKEKGLPLPVVDPEDSRQLGLLMKHGTLHRNEVPTPMPHYVMPYLADEQGRCLACGVVHAPGAICPHLNPVASGLSLDPHCIGEHPRATAHGL